MGTNDYIVGQRRIFCATIERISWYEREADPVRHIPSSVVWRYQFVEHGTGQRLVYSGTYHHDISALKERADITMMATIKRVEPKYGSVRLKRPIVQKEPENLFA